MNVEVPLGLWTLLHASRVAQSSFTWTWDECRANPVEDCWDRFERGAPFSVWVKTRKRKRTPFAGVIGSATATPFTGKRERGTA